MNLFPKRKEVIMAYFISRCKIITKTQAFRLKLFVLYGFSYNSPN